MQAQAIFFTPAVLTTQDAFKWMGVMAVGIALFQVDCGHLFFARQILPFSAYKQNSPKMLVYKASWSHHLLKLHAVQILLWFPMWGGVVFPARKGSSEEDYYFSGEPKIHLLRRRDT